MVITFARILSLPLYGSAGGNHIAPTSGITTSYNVSTMTAAQWAQALTANVVEFASDTDCGGCSINSTDIATIAAHKSQITNYFNNGGDIFGGTSANAPGYYDAFLPSAYISTTTPISIANGFYATTAGLAAGFNNTELNGDLTHNTFTNIPSSFTVLERLSSTGIRSATDPAISIGLLNGTISGVGITTGTAVPEPFTVIGTLIGGAAAFKIRKRLKVDNKL